MPKSNQPLKISQVIEFFEGIREREGDLEIESVTGFWTRMNFATGQLVVVPSVGDGKSIQDVICLMREST